MKQRYKHLRHQTKRHIEAHENLKRLLKLTGLKKRENLFEFFAITFVVALTLIFLFKNGGAIVGFLKNETSKAPQSPTAISSEIAKKGALATMRVSDQTESQKAKLIRTIPSLGHAKGVEVAGKLLKSKETSSSPALPKSIGLTTSLSSGQFMTRLDQGRAKGVLKSVVATYYLTEKRMDGDSTLTKDTQILTEVNNVLSVDLFAYLNQADSRADALDQYLNLLNRVKDKVDERKMDLQGKLSFLNANFNATEAAVKSTEQEFFRNLQALNGPDAETKLSQFIGLQSSNVEIRAMAGALNQLLGYYTFFSGRLDNLLKAVSLNRDPLIAGVRVIEIENMTLPLIERQR